MSAPAFAQAGPPPRPPSAEPRLAVTRDTAHSADPLVAIRAMQLSSAQVQAIAAVRARYAPQLRKYVDQLNVLASQHAAAAMQATQDTLRTLTPGERSAADSVITPLQRQRFDSVMNVVHRSARVPAQRRPRTISDSAATSTGRP